MAVDMTKPGAQEYYNSEFQQFADWGVDFVKIDDLSRPYHGPEIEAIRKAIDLAGRPMVFSTSQARPRSVRRRISPDTRICGGSAMIFGITGRVFSTRWPFVKNGLRTREPAIIRMPTCCRWG